MKYLILAVTLMFSGCMIKSSEINTAKTACKNNDGIDVITITLSGKYVHCNNSAQIKIGIYKKENKQ